MEVSLWYARTPNGNLRIARTYETPALPTWRFSWRSVESPCPRAGGSSSAIPRSAVAREDTSRTSVPPSRSRSRTRWARNPSVSPLLHPADPDARASGNGRVDTHPDLASHPPAPHGFRDLPLRRHQRPAARELHALRDLAGHPRGGRPILARVGKASYVVELRPADIPEQLIEVLLGLARKSHDEMGPDRNPRETAPQGLDQPFHVRSTHLPAHPAEHRVRHA